MSAIKKLAGQTALYGLPSILGRFLNYLLVPLHTSSQFTPGEYGVVTEMYAYVTFFVVLLTYGMETAFFRFCRNNPKESVYANALFSLALSSIGFFALVYFFAPVLAEPMGYSAHPEYLLWFAGILSLDAVSAITMARLREEERPLWFAFVNMTSIAVNIGLNLFWLLYCYQLHQSGADNWLSTNFYNPTIGIGYIFIAALLSSAVKFVLLLPQALKVKFEFDKILYKQMLRYALPLLLAGFAGMINETLDRVLMKYLLRDEIGEAAAMNQLGIYGGVYKLSIIITLFIQAFRYAAEPFFFRMAGQNDSKQGYVTVMNYFVFIVMGIFLFVSIYIDFFKQFLRQEAYWEGLHIVPVLLLANAFLGISFNLSIWYKLSDKTIYGAYMAIGGALVTIVLNVLWIPAFGYTGAAWATLVCYFLLAASSYVLGQRFYTIPYQLSKNLGVFAIALALFFTDKYLVPNFVNISFILKFSFLLIFVAAFVYLEKPTFIFRKQ